MPTAYEMEKYCSKCQKYKSLKDFSKDCHTKSGIRHWCKECCNKAQRYSLSLHREENRQKSREYRLAHPEQCKVSIAKYKERVKREVLSHYGDGKLACVMCGEERLPCLSLDHILGNGQMNTEELGKEEADFIHIFIPETSLKAIRLCV